MLKTLQCLLAMLASACGAGFAGAQEQANLESLIEQALDEPIDLEINDQPILAALNTISEKSGVPIRLEDNAVSLLPYGQDTSVNAAMHGVTLRQGMQSLFRRLGMECHVQGDTLLIKPTGALRRIGRRATWSEVETLEWLASTAWTGQPDQNEALRSKLQFRVSADDPVARLLDAMRGVGNGTLDEVLSVATRNLAATWYPWGDHIAIVSTSEQVYRELQKPISLTAEHKRIADVIAEFAAKAQVTVHVEAGALAGVSREIREDFSLLLVNVPAIQGLETISGASGLVYRIEGDGVVITAPGAAHAADLGGESAGADVVLRVRSSDGNELLIRRDQLPPEALKAIDEFVTGIADSLTVKNESREPVP